MSVVEASTRTLLDQLQLLPVPAGTATLGLDEKLAAKFTNSYGEIWHEFYYRELPQHPVVVSAFNLARYPVTNGLYAQFMADGGYENGDFWTPEGWAWRLTTNRIQPNRWGEPAFAGDVRPVVGVTWFEAMAFTRWASSVTGQAIRLPTEAEWEWAARGENVRWLYPWGGVWDPSKLNSGFSDENHPSLGTTAPVGTYSPAGDGPFGHSDLLGQVWEWTSTIFRPYPYVADDREDPYTPERRILRGGCWGDSKYANRVTTRYHYPAAYGDVTTGFRVASGGDAGSLVERPAHDLVIYGRSSFCADLVHGKEWLRAWGIPYRQLNIDLDERAARRLDAWLETRTIPTYVVAERGQIDPIAPPTEVDPSHLRNADRGSMLHEADESGLRTWLVRNNFLGNL